MVSFVLPLVMKIVEYLDGNGVSPFGRWFASIEARAASKVTVALTRLSHGNVSNVKSVGAGVFECRLDYGPGYRLYFGRDGAEVVVLLTGGTKVRQEKDIVTAHAFWRDYKSRKGS